MLAYFIFGSILNTREEINQRQRVQYINAVANLYRTIFASR